MHGEPNSVIERERPFTASGMVDVIVVERIHRSPHHFQRALAEVRRLQFEPIQCRHLLPFSLCFVGCLWAEMAGGGAGRGGGGWPTSFFGLGERR
jgi:hypothetical protein